MLTEKEKNYYIKRKPKLMKLFDTSQKLVRNFWIERFGDAKFEELFTNIRQEFEALIPELPYIGGRKNRNYDNLINSTMMLAVIRGLEKEGLEFQDIGKLCYDLYETYYEILPTSGEKSFNKSI